MSTNKNMNLTFHYKIDKYLGKNDKRCEQIIPSVWRTYRCKRKAVKKIDGASLCSQHFNALLKWRKI